MEHWKDEPRPRAEVDRRKMEELFENLFFQVTPLIDCEAKYLKNRVKEISNGIGKKCPTYCFACFVSGYGNIDEHGYFIIDQLGDKLYVVEDLAKPFMTCEGLLEKPKVFFINTCSKKLEVNFSHPQREEYNIVPPITSQSTEKTVEFVKYHTDSLAVYSTKIEDESAQGLDDGSYFVQTLHDAIQENHNTKDIQHIVSNVNHFLVRNIHPGHERNCHVATSHSKLTRKLYWRTYIDPGTLTFLPLSINYEHVISAHNDFFAYNIPTS